jgi:16S rRNA (cytosine1402-N4)-methyltransferase
MTHTTVLLHEAVDALLVAPESIVVDATFGSGGHAREIASLLGPEGTLIGIDADESALQREKLGETEATIHLINDNFRNITETLRSLHIEEVDAILADLGWRMEQFADGQKGFSFLHDGPLHMTFGDPGEYAFTAHDIVNGWEEHVIADIIYGYGEERFARRIAKAIVTERKHAPIETTYRLVEVIKSAVPKVAQRGKTHPATKTFQALRMAVNEELPALEEFIQAGFTVLKPGGRLAIITFHSIEDRVVKHAFRAFVDSGAGELVTKKPIPPSETEVRENPRARSAKLRIIRKYT